MRYFMHSQMEIPFSLAKDVRRYFKEINTMETEVIFRGKTYKAIVDIDSFLHPSNFDCFNCLTNCCVQFPYEFNERAREIILNNLQEYDSLTKAVSILEYEGLTLDEIKDYIRDDRMLIPEKHVKTTFDRCTCSCVHVDRNLCALHKICLDNGMNMEETIDAKPLWCSIYPLEILTENDESLLYIFVPNEGNDFMSMNDSDFPCMNIAMSKSPYFRRENPTGFREEDYKPFIKSYYGILRYILGEKFVNDIIYDLDLENEELEDEKKSSDDFHNENSVNQYSRKI